MKKLLCILIATCSLWACNEKQFETSVGNNTLRAPGYPLITIDPYTSGWSLADNLYDENIKHWTGKDFPLIGAIKVDDKVYRFMGSENIPFLSIAPTSEQGKWSGKYTTEKPEDNWMNSDFDDTLWTEGEGAFGTPDSEPISKTPWYQEFLWVRRIINITEDLNGKKVYLEYSHDDDAIIYINGIEVVNTGNTCKKNVLLPLSQEVVASLKKGKNIIAGYCHNRGANGLLDFGLVREKEHNQLLSTTAVQTSVCVQPTQTYYTFDCGPVELKVIFTAPLLMEDLELISRPVNYITYEVKSKDKKSHIVDLYFEASEEWALDKLLQPSVMEGFEKDNLLFLRTGSVDQNILQKQGDDVRIDWGYFYLVSEKENASYCIGESEELRTNFINNIRKESVNLRENINEKLSIIHSLGKVNHATGKLMVGYDDLYSIQYFGTNLRPYWNRMGNQTIIGQFLKANVEYEKLMKKCNAFDKELMIEATRVGGWQYAELCALAYRQAISAHKLVEAPNGDLLFLSKENNSNGSIGTVDVTYPSAPLFLYYNPELAKGLLNHIFYYSESGKWLKPFPAHDIGTYPLGNGQTYGDDMPVEEAGNMIILTAAVVAMEGNPEYVEKHWEVLAVWADYLAAHGLDPDNQLCTDDFAGHFAHNANLSVKAIMGVASYAYMAEIAGKNEIAATYRNKAKEMAAEWMGMADDGDHYRLTFDQPGTWSQKYNLVWDKLLQMNLFPPEVAEKEIAFYLKKQNRYGLPLDNRDTYTKTDWIIWTATLANDQETFEQLVHPIYKFMNETVDRVPMSDWVFTDKPHYRGFKARSVVGGYFIKMLEEKMKN